MNDHSLLVYMRGGGDLASGVALRLFRAGLRLIIAELPQPLVVRRWVAFAEAIYQGEFTVEGVTSRRAQDLAEAFAILEAGQIAVIVDPQAAYLSDLGEILAESTPIVLVDGRMTKKTPESRLNDASFIIGLGPGFEVGVNCHAAVETNRGHRLGRVLWEGAPQDDTGFPDWVAERGIERVLRAPADGELEPQAEIGAHLEAGQVVAVVEGRPVFAPFKGVLRGLIHPQVRVREGMKIGDLDPRDDPSFCRLVSEKSLAIGGGVLEAILSRPELRPNLWR